VHKRVSRRFRNQLCFCSPQNAHASSIILALDVYVSLHEHFERRLQLFDHYTRGLRRVTSSQRPLLSLEPVNGAAL